ncbi:MAG: helix-turn-helix domain-containing protein [Porphyrobacter sp.]|nr:helix-turn-helix domain-containing protein [Porphyrobacter sp.]
MTPIALTVAETVKLLGVGRTTIYRLISEERLSSIKIGRRTLILMASIEKLIDSEQAR